MALLINQGTNSAVNFDLSGTINTQVIAIGYGTVSTLGTLPNIPGGTIGVVSSLSAGTITKVEGGTIGLITRVGNLGTLESGTISSLPNIPGGTLGVVQSISAGTITRVEGGTINAATVVLNSGTINVATISAGTVVVGIGTITHGTIDAGTVRIDARTTQNIITFGTQIAATAALVATIVGSASVGAGTSLWVNDISIINPYGSVLCVIGFGTAQQGTNVLLRGILGTQTGVGIEKQFPKLVNAGMTNQDLVFSTGAAGTIDLSISYLISA
jgi:hypothetical protein